MREDEERCKNAFDTFLKQYYRDGDITWTCGDKNKPPDYFLQLRGNKYAVEVTSILEKATLGNKTIDHIEIDKSVKRFIEYIQKDAFEEGILKGAYVVRYKPISDFGKQKRIIATRIRDYLRRTQNVSSAPAEDIAGEDSLRWYIYKIQSDKSRLSRRTEDANFKGEPEAELCNLLNKALETKVKKLKTISLPKILLLYDRFAWINADEWKQYLSKLSYVDNFHTIFLVSDKSNNSVLHSVESSWSSRF